MKFIIILLLFLLIPLAYADTTFFDQDNMIIMANPTAAVVTGGTGGGIPSGRVAVMGKNCTDRWDCTEWGECSFFGKQTRSCVHISNCSDYEPPPLEQHCIYTATGMIIWREIADKKGLIIYSGIILLIVAIVLYLNKDFLKKLKKK